MNVNEPVVSVLMTAYNRGNYIAEAIESVLASTWQNFELVIVDDYSTDKTLEIAQSYTKKDNRVRVYQNEKNLGDYPNRNQAASYARGKYIKFLDSDDIIYPCSLQVMVNAMEKFPDAGYGLAATPDQKQPYPACITSKEAYQEHFNGFGHFDRSPGSSIIRLDAFRRIGGFSGKRMIGDNELWYKLSMYYPLVKFPRDLVWHRSHSEQESKSEFARKYEKMRQTVMYEALSHPDCPLNEMEKKSIEKVVRRRKFKNRAKTFLTFYRRFFIISIAGII